MNAWREKIIRALEAEDKVLPGRAGATPLSRLADDLNGLRSTPQNAVAAMEAFTSLIKRPSEKLAQKRSQDYWAALSFLTEYIPVPDKSGLASAFRARLFGKLALTDDLKVHALNGFIVAGGKLYRRDLENLASILEKTPLAWLAAAIMSGEHDLAKKIAIGLLKNNTIDIRMLLLSLDLWNKNWQRGENFINVVYEFSAAAATQKAKSSINKWLARRGYLADAESGQGKLETVTRYSFIPPSLYERVPNKYWNGT